MKSKKLQKKNVKAIAVALSGLSVIASLGFGFGGTAFANTEENYCEFSSTRKVIHQYDLQDFGDNTFKLYELEDGYAIYSVLDGVEEFIEGSYEKNSPYFKYRDCNDLRYLGPGNYLYSNGADYIDILSDTVYVKMEEECASYVLNDTEEIELYSTSSPNPNYTYTDTAGYTLIKNAEYFKNLTCFPINSKGTCGITALSMLLSYHDTFSNPNFIANDKQYNGLKFILDGYATYKHDVVNYSFKEWLTMPGATTGFGDYLIDNYMKTAFGIGGESGYPMLNGELEKTVKGYMQANCPDLLNKIDVKTGNTFFTHKNTKNHINDGNPTCLILQSFTAENGYKDNDHIVVAYGYKDDKYAVHTGWRDMENMILSKATIQGYYTFYYTGAHVHSKNTYMRERDVKYICGCGYVQ